MPALKKTGISLLALLPIAAAVVIVILLIRNSDGPKQTAATEKVLTVRIMDAQKFDVVPRVVGFGYVQPDKTWDAVAQVSGKVVEINPDLKKGAFFPKDTLLIRIDPTEYELQMKQAQASIDEVTAKIQEIKARRDNLKASLAIERDSLAIARRQVGRREELLKENTIPPAELDREQQSFYMQKAKVQDLENALSLIPPQLDNLEAQKAIYTLKYEDAQLNKEYTFVRAPFNCRITAVYVEQSQFVPVGTVMAEADGTAKAEIEVQIPVNKMINLLKASQVQFNIQNVDIPQLKERIGLTATVWLRSGNFNASWDASFARTSASFDPQTRSVGVIVVVDDPYAHITLGKRPPLVRNMFCEVELRGKPIEGQFAVLRSALHDSSLYGVDQNNRLLFLPVTVQFAQDGFYVIESGLNGSEKIILTDVVPAIEGLLLEPVYDHDAVDQLKRQTSATINSM